MSDTKFPTNTEQEEMHTKFWSENLTRRDYLEDQGTPERIKLKWIQRKSELGDLCWIKLAQDRVQQGGCCERGNEPSGPINCEQLLD
jgi:hypothetical protein